MLKKKARDCRRRRVKRRQIECRCGRPVGFARLDHVFQTQETNDVYASICMLRMDALLLIERRAIDGPASATGRRGVERGDIDHETIFHIALQHSLIGCVDLLDSNHLDVRNDPLLRAEVEHFLRFRDTANQ